MKLGTRPLRRLTYLTTLAVALILVAVATSALPSILALASGPLVWTTKAPMPVARNGPGVVAASNGKIYAISGGDAAGAAEFVGTMNEYNPATNTWVAKAPIPTPRFTFGVAEATNGKIYAIAGWSAGWHTYAVEEYNPATNTWATKASALTERSMLAAAAASNGKVYAIGGMFYVGFTALNTVEEYDPATDTWATKAPMPTARSFLAAVTASNGKIYAIGGCTSGFASALATVEEYNPATNSWATKAPMPTTRCGLAAVAAPNGKIYAIGGTTDMVNSLATVDEYDPATDTWTSATSMPTARSGLGAAVSGGKIYAIGGSNGVSLATVEEATGAGPAPTPTPTATLVPGVSTLGMVALTVVLVAAYLWARRRRLAE